RALEARLAAAATSRRADVRRWLPRGLRARSPDPARAALARRAQPGGAQPRAVVGCASVGGAGADPGRLGDRRAHDHAPRRDDGSDGVAGLASRLIALNP